MGNNFQTMRLRGYIFLIGRSIRRNPSRIIFNIISMAIGASILCAALTAYFSVREPLLRELGRAFPENRLLAKPKTLGLGPLQVNRSKLTGDVISKIRRIRGVTAVYPIQPLWFPVRAEGRIFGEEISSDIVVSGAPPELVENSLSAGQSFAMPLPGEPLPVVISRYFLDLYNLGLAQSNNLPQLNESSAVGRTFSLVLGESTISGLVSVSKSKTIACKVVGFTPDVSLFGLIIPLEAVEKYNLWYAGREVSDYTQAQVEIADAREFDRIRLELSGLGLMVESNRNVMQYLKMIANIISMIIMSLAVGVLFLAAVNLTHSERMALMERRGELGLLGALGATRKMMRWIYLGEKSITGLAAGLIGAGAFALCWNIVMTNLPDAVRRLPIIGSAIPQMRLDAAVLAIVILFIAFWGAVICYLPIRRLLRLYPARLLKE
ncbi:MAG TPA: ABC transporter permease [Candidatus Sumerlaeia bacterium]|nr:MAG: FtsX-like permease family protein [candidate division BRC1 bacterium ADurb.Bin183]HRR31479.1 ABC transporter permease [Candidatus Sumerlaeia bacterium]HRR98794.1 ABC transporter permease [Candidatus Sumerlaeia bacterium]